MSDVPLAPPHREPCPPEGHVPLFLAWAAARGPAGDPDPGRSAEVDRRRAQTTVLLVDDLDDQRELYREYLEFAGYDVVVARDGFEGIDRALSARPDVVIMDLAMPGMDGFEATQRLKLLDKTRGIPVIALTAHGELPREWALGAGCSAYLRKPCYPNDLAVEIESVLDKSRRARPEPVPPSAPVHAHVLIVDRSVADRELLAEYLEFRGCTVTVTVAAGAAARDARRARPHVILLDLDDARLGGWETLRSLQREPRTRHIPVIGLSRQAGASARERALSLGMVLMRKPCEPEALALEVGRAAATSPRDPD